MLNLQPLVARFVDDILSAIRSASLDDLRDLSPALLKSETRKAKPEAPPRTAPRPTGRTAAPRPTLARPRSRPIIDREPSPSAEPESPGDITDPATLLVMGMDHSRREPPRSRPEVAPVEHAAKRAMPRATAPANANLRAGETVARAGASGLIIRRAKRPT
jgi:hypothetical protein